MTGIVTPDHPAAEELWSSDAFRDRWRKAARRRFVASVSGDFDTPAEWEAAATLLEAWLDTWALAGLTDASLERWREAADPTALAVLGRGAEVIAAATGWDTGAEGPWPAPPADRWADMGGGAATDPGEEGRVVGGLLVVEGRELASRRAELARLVVTGPVKAVTVAGDGPLDAASQLALGELRMEATHQDAWDRFGRSGLAAAHAPPRWDELLGRAPAGGVGERPARRCEAVFAPGPASAVRRGELADVGYLVWEGPFAPLAVQREAVLVARALDGSRSAEEIARASRLPPEFVEAVIAELVAVGAAGSM